jgi:integrase
VNKKVNGRRYHRSTGEKSRAGAERFMTRFLASLPKADDPFAGPIFRDAAIRHLLTTERKRPDQDASLLAGLYPHLADKPLKVIDRDTLQPFLMQAKEKGLKSNTLNRYLAIVRHIQNKASREWKQPNGEFWLKHAPHIPALKVRDARAPYTILPQEQKLLLKHMAPHLKEMVLFALNTGLRNSEVCSLRWEWLKQEQGSEVWYFEIPGKFIKNGQNRIVVLNSVAEGLILSKYDNQRSGQVFTYQGKGLKTMNGAAWKTALSAAAYAYEETIGIQCPEGFQHLRVHDLRHTVGHRLRVAGVSEWDTAHLLGHSVGSITSFYSQPSLTHLKNNSETIS